MWNPFRRHAESGQTAPPPPQPSNRVEDLANTLDKEGRAKDLERELQRLDYSSFSPVEQETWWHLYGITAFHDGRDAVALQRFQEAHEKFPGSARIRFSLGQQYIRAREIDRGFELFRTCVFPTIPREFALAQARYAYVWSRYADGLAFIRPFFDAYRQLKILDDTFLYMRGLPPFGRWWSHFAALSILSGDVTELESVTTFVVENCHDYDLEYLQAELKAYRDDRPEHMLAPLEKRLRGIPGDFPTGYTRMNIAVVKARRAGTFDDARAELMGVALSPHDFPWLEDIRTLALAEAAHRFGDPAREAERIISFLERQPMLFEPDIAVEFHLLRYQQLLKPTVTARDQP
jgi:hypothetical protein